MSKTFWYIFVLCVLSTVSVLYITRNDITQMLFKEDEVEEISEAATLRKATVFWEKEIREIGPKEAYASFVAEAKQLPLSAHNQAHAFGEALYNTHGLSGLQYCDSSFEFGCYHSFFGVAVKEKGIGVLSEFSEACKSKFGDFNLPCEHGIGHGVLVYTDYENLEEALELCRTISDLPTGGCSSGVFMENNFHTMDETVSEAYVREKNDDIYAPCTSLPEVFQASCYFEQVQWWQNVFNNDFSYIAELCAGIDTHTEKEACYHGMGNYVAAFANFDVDSIGNICATIQDSKAHSMCLEGASWLVLPEVQGKEKAKALCMKAQTDEHKNLCLSKI